MSTVPFNKNEKRFIKYIAALVDYFDELSIIPRDVFRYPFDTVALELLSKSVSIARSSIALIKADQAEEAFGLSRSLVEIYLVLRHLTRDDDLKYPESYKFLHFSLVDKSFWLHHANRVFTDPEMKAEIERLASQWNLSELNPMSATRSWSDKYNSWKSQSTDHPLDGQTNPLPLRTSAYSIEYTQASFFTHCTQPALNNFFPPQGEPFRIRPSSKEFVDSRGIVFFLLLTNLHQISFYVLYGLNLDAPSILADLFSKIVAEADAVQVRREKASS